MKKLLNKEWRLSSLMLTKLFILFGLLTFLPGYPILMGAFFVCLGLFQSFQNMRENNDILFSALLPVAKRDIVSAKFLLCLSVEGAAFVVMSVVTVLRMTVLSDAAVYRDNALMTANLCFLGFVLLCFALFNGVFVRGFFRTAYYYGKPFVVFTVAAMGLIVFAEAVHYFPGMGWVNAFGCTNMGLQAVFLVLCGAVSTGITAYAWRQSVRDFERIDL